MSENRMIVNEVVKLFPKIEEILASTKLNVEVKEGFGNIVTRTDLMIENYFKDSLIRMFPDCQIIAEESDDVQQDSKSLKFIIDPLDGTTNYTNSWPHSVAIGIVKNDTLIGGIIYNVLSKTIYIGVINEGVKKCNINDINMQTEVKGNSSSNTEIKKAVISYDTPYSKEAYELTQKVCYELYLEGASLKTVGPISLDVLKTALGKENLPNEYNEATWHMEVRAWDLAAATCILRELGGEIIGKDGQPLSIETLTDVNARIAFIASKSKAISEKIYQKFIKTN